MSQSKIVLCSLLFCLSAGSLSAQITGALKGVVMDSSEAAIQQANVTLTSSETGAARRMQTDLAGNFSFALLPIGAYQVQVEADGFRAEVTEADVRVGEVTSIRFRLEVGQVTEKLTVYDVTTPLDAENSQAQYAVNGFDIQTIPVQRDPNLYATLAPGVVPISPNHNFLGTGSYSNNGGRGRGNNITVDNITTTDISVTGTGGVLNVLNFADLKEVKFISNNFSAEYGRNANSQMLYVLKSGTNEFHGDVFYVFRNDKLNARPFFDRTGKANIVRWNQWGYSIGGPVYIPKLIDGRNKLFWTQSYEGGRERGASATRIATVPTPSMIGQITDPASAALLEQYQIPVTDSGQLEQSAGTFTDLAKVNVKLDWHATTKDIITGRYAQAGLTSGSANATFVHTNLRNFGFTTTADPRQASLAWTRVFSATVVNEARSGYGRGENAFPLKSTVPLGPDVRFMNGEVNAFGQWAGLPQGRVQNTFQFTDTLTWVKGAHTIKGGFDLFRYQNNSFADVLTRGFVFFPSWSAFAQGQPFLWNQWFGSTVRGYRAWDHSYFLQDDWKVNPNFTLNLGLRVEVAGGPSEVNGIISNLNLDCDQPFGALGKGPLGCLETGKPVYGRKVNWAPRVGFAWSLGADRKTVIRGGYGIAHDFLFFGPISNQRGLPPFVVDDILFRFSGDNSWGNLLAGTSTFQRDANSRVGQFNPEWVNFGRINPAIDRGLRNPQVHHWSIGIQRELARDLVVKFSYVGTKGNFLQRTRSFNLLANPPAAATSIDDETARLGEFETATLDLDGSTTQPSLRIDPRYNEVDYVDSSANSNFHSFQATAEKRFSNGYMFMVAYTYGKSIDDVSDALGVLIGDSSDQQDPLDNGNNRAPSQFDIRQRLVITHNWQLPFGQNVRNPVLWTIVAGWGLSGVTSFRTGFPVTVLSGPRRDISPSTANGGSSSAPVRPNINGDLSGWNPQPAGSAGAPSGLNQDPVQPISSHAASLGLSQPLLGNIGSLGRNPIRINGQVNFDWQIYKDTPLAEGVTFRIAGEFYNLFNSPTFQDVNTTITNPNFGQYTTVANDSRIVQIQARIVF